MIKAADLLPRARDPHTVVVAELPDGRQFKVTGYERTAIWARRPELAPLQVHVIVVLVASAEEAGCLYDGAMVVEAPCGRRLGNAGRLPIGVSCRLNWPKCRRGDGCLHREKKTMALTGTRNLKECRASLGRKFNAQP
jgi:hypothetical protein